MERMTTGIGRPRGVAFVGDYLPRKCGIATFTHDLAEAVALQAGSRQAVTVCAMNDIEEGYDYPERVKFEVRQDYPMDYARAADFLNFSRVDVVSLQHEYGIFGGMAGSNILTLLRELRWPLVVTCHTVMKDPSSIQKEVLCEIAARARKLVVMSEKAVSLMEKVYGVDRDKTVMIPHGIHDVPFVDPSFYKDKFGVEGRQVLLTFGLLVRNKGIEDVIEALPEIVAKHPKVTYVVLGATHPEAIRVEGESYRLELQRRVIELELEEHVLFHPRFVDAEELLEYIGASDILITPYHSLDQITSGALSYAMGAGKAIISTPYWHATELLAKGRGRLVDVGDSGDIAKNVIDLLDDDVTLSKIRKQAYTYCRNMIWPKTARAYLDLFDEVRSRTNTIVPITSAMKRTISASSIPTPKLDHVIRLSDDTGICHHALRIIPDWTYGYWLGDQAMALVAATKFHDVFGRAQASELAIRYFRIVHYLLKVKNTVTGTINYKREPIDDASERRIAQCVWAIGYTVSHGALPLRESANDVFNDLVPVRVFGDIHACGYAILGAADYLARFPGASAVRRYLTYHTNILSRSIEGADWLQNWEGADYGIPVQALAVASAALDAPELFTQANNLALKLIEKTEGGSVFKGREDNPDEEEMPISAMCFIEALGALYNIEKDEQLLKHIRVAAEWFLGVNRRQEPLYNFQTASCADALTASGCNQNQGAEATLACLISFLTLYELAGSDSEYARR